MDLSTPPQVVLGSALKRFTKRELARMLEVDPRTVIRWGDGGSMPAHYKMALMWLLVHPGAPAPRAADFTFIDLFAGIGGMRLGFEAAGGRCVFSSEWDEGCQKTYRDNFGDEEIFGDIREITNTGSFERIPRHDVLLAGFPCQPFSIAGVSKKNALGHAHGFACEAQGTLFFDVAKIIEVHRPLAFVLENVKNLRSHDRGNTFRVIMDVLQNQLAYDVHVEVIDAKGFVPQHRERIFIVGFREKVGFTWDALRRPPQDAARLSEVLHPEDGTEETEEPYTKGPKAMVSPKYTLSDHLWTYLQAYREKHAKRGNGFGYSLFSRNDTATRTLSARYYKDGSEILIQARRGRNPRRLTPRECARLMGFDARGRRFRIPVSDTRAYEQFGNAVVVPVVREVAGLVAPFVREIRECEATGARQGALFSGRNT
jgi:DNA (cytosine-5)-methyltransferase 1